MEDQHKYFNPLSLYRERQLSPGMVATYQKFQSTLPIQGETGTDTGISVYAQYFNPLSLYRERLAVPLFFIPCNIISIHSPYTGRDDDYDSGMDAHNISIHSPYTGRDFNEVTK